MQIFEACGDAASFLAQDPEHVVALHCKAGKGRTGLMVCCLLLHLGVCTSPADAMQFYATRRTFNGKGLTIPSQKRYVCYFHLQLQAIRRQFGNSSGRPSSADAVQGQAKGASAVAPAATGGSESDAVPLTTVGGSESDAVPLTTVGGSESDAVPLTTAGGKNNVLTSQHDTHDDAHAGPAGDDEQQRASNVQQEPNQPQSESSGTAAPAALSSASPQGASEQDDPVSPIAHASAAIGPWAPTSNSTVVPKVAATVRSICVRGRALSHSHLGVAIYRRVPGSLQRELVLRCPAQPVGGASSPGTKDIPMVSMPATLFQGIQTPLSALGDKQDSHLLLSDAGELPLGQVKCEPDLTVWQGESVMGEDGVDLQSTDYHIVITGHSSTQSAGKKIAAAWVNAAFLPHSAPDVAGGTAPGMLSLGKWSLDKVFKDKGHKIVSSHFALHLLYDKTPLE